MTKKEIPLTLVHLGVLSTEPRAEDRRVLMLLDPDNPRDMDRIRVLGNRGG